LKQIKRHKSKRARLKQKLLRDPYGENQNDSFDDLYDSGAEEQIQIKKL